MLGEIWKTYIYWQSPLYLLIWKSTTVSVRNTSKLWLTLKINDLNKLQLLVLLHEIIWGPWFTQWKFSYLIIFHIIYFNKAMFFIFEISVEFEKLDVVCWHEGVILQTSCKLVVLVTGWEPVNLKLTKYII